MTSANSERVCASILGLSVQDTICIYSLWHRYMHCWACCYKTWYHLATAEPSGFCKFCESNWIQTLSTPTVKRRVCLFGGGNEPQLHQLGGMGVSLNRVRSRSAAANTYPTL